MSVTREQIEEAARLAAGRFAYAGDDADLAGRVRAEAAEVLGLDVEDVEVTVEGSNVEITFRERPAMDLIDLDFRAGVA